MVQRNHTGNYDKNMRSNKVEYSKAVGPYCTTNNIKVMFCMSEFPIINIISHRFHVDNNKVDMGIGYDMVIGHALMVQIGLMKDLCFKLYNGMILQYRQSIQAF